MVFEDKTGKRWKRLKKSGITALVTSGIGVVTMAAVTLIYLPHWGQLQLPNIYKVPDEVAGVLGAIPQAASAKAAGKPTPSPSKPTPTPATKPKVLGAATGPLATTNTPVPSATPRPGVTPKTTSSPSPSPSPTTAPGNSGFGHSHH